MRWLAVCLLSLLLSGPRGASATPFTVDFVTHTFGSMQDPAGLLPTGWSAGSGFAGVPTSFAGSWTYAAAAVDQDPAPRAGDFVFSDPSLTIELEAGGITYQFQLERIRFFYSDVSGDWSWYSVSGSSTSSPIAGVDLASIEIFWGNMSPLPTALIPAVDSPHPIPGSPWEDGSGFSRVTVAGSGASGAYEFRKVLGSHGEAYAVPEPASGALLGAGLLALARRRERTARR
jgi:hypothetical protein